MNHTIEYQDVCKTCHWHLSADITAPCGLCPWNHALDIGVPPSVNRTFKSSLFVFSFKDKKDLLTLYNSLNGSDYSDPEQLVINTLHNAIYLSMKNDVSFLLGSTMNLYEHQSTYNPNMPLRGFLYFAQLYEKFITSRNINIYSSKLQILPTPQYIVFYNGTELQPDKITLRLSDAFASEDGCLECTATMLNINHGRNRELMEKCQRLKEYSLFVARVRQHIESAKELSVAINMAIDECISEGILNDILTQSKAEVHDMVLTTFNRELYEKGLREDAYEDGKASLLKTQIQKKLSKGKSIEIIAEELEESVDVIQAMCKELA